MPPATYTHDLTVRFRDCDALGHVNNAVFLTYLEEARAAWFFAVVGGPRDPERFNFILASVQIAYKSPVRYGERIRVEVGVGEVRNRSFALEYALSTGDRPVATATTVQVTYDYTVGTPVPIPPDLAAALSRG
ncbi:MAG: acyl-CoA thioesterase [Candidatus Sericytochromatia bacterium]|nr:acyl-CoA thioesterase [Candidatus Tanganyikabacteria bacterium]